MNNYAINWLFHNDFLPPLKQRGTKCENQIGKLPLLSNPDGLVTGFFSSTLCQMRGVVESKQAAVTAEVDRDCGCTSSLKKCTISVCQYMMNACT